MAYDKLSRGASYNYTSFKIINSDFTEIPKGTRFAFRGQNYVRILIRLFLDAIDKETYIDSGYSVTLVDKPQLLVLLPEVEIRRIALPLHIKGLGLVIYNTNEYVLIPIFIPAVKDDINILYRIFREIYLVDNLKVYMLLGNNIIGPKRIILDIS